MKRDDFKQSDKTGADNAKPAKEPAAKGAPKKVPTAKGGTAKGGKSSKAAPKTFERFRGGAARSIADLMPDVGRTAFRRFGFMQSSVVSRWPQIVGPRHARVCSPESIRFPIGEKSDGVLQLVVMAAHAPMIQHVIPEIIERVNRFFGYNAVVKVKIRQGDVKPPPTTPPRTTQPTQKPVPPELGASLSSITDPELRAVLESLARSIDAKDSQENK